MATMDVYLTDIGKRWLQDHYPQGIIWEYGRDKLFKLHSVAADFAELTYLGIPCCIPHTSDGKPNIAKTIKKVA